MTMTVFYTAGDDKDPHGLTEPRAFGLTVEEAATFCGEFFVMWSPTYEVFGLGFKVPGPSTRFFHQGREIINPWACFRPIPERPVRGAVDETKLFEAFNGRE